MLGQRRGLVVVGLLLGVLAPLALRAEEPEDPPHPGTTVADPDATMRDRLKTIPWDKLEVIVVEGEFDHVEGVLAALKIPHKKVSFEGFQDLLEGKKAAVMPPEDDPPKKALPPIQKLDPQRQVLVINCTSQTLNGREARALAGFVGKGGYLLTTDWSLEILADAFPHQVRLDTEEQLDGTHKVRIKRSALSHPLLADLRKPEAEFDWWFEGASYAARVKNGKEVTVLATCPELDDTPVALTFETGAVASGGGPSARGRVLHFVSHLEQQEFDEDGAYNLQMAFLNFVRLKARALGAGK